MPSYFFDSSAIIKRYHQEQGSSWVQAVCNPRSRQPVHLSRLAEVEVVAGLRRTGRSETCINQLLIGWSTHFGNT